MAGRQLVPGAALAASVLLAAGVVCQSSAALALTRPAAAAATEQPAAQGESIVFDADLLLPGAGGIASAAAAISDPAGPAYRRYLSAADFGARFGLPLADIAHVASWLSRQGFAVVNA
ncbi:MAG TPA: protease pro-enzyme activation domain-containing protein, partial [Candidatus Limnocylindrales bacterium]|nr:protease pro-enzyme activation domain-containing protein [Candidatus Limnocylindrales bacterium]